MIDYSEKRAFIRLPLNCPVSIRDQQNADEEIGELIDLSATGVRFHCQRQHEAGAHLQMHLSPDYPITPPLEAELSVVRCHEIDDGFDIAASIDLIAPAVYPDD